MNNPTDSTQNGPNPKHPTDNQPIPNGVGGRGRKVEGPETQKERDLENARNERKEGEKGET